jgi:hypothetical protein
MAQSEGLLQGDRADPGFADVGNPAEDAQPVLIVERAEVTGAVPSRVEVLRFLGRAVPVALGHGRRLYFDRAGGGGLEVVLQDDGAAAEQGPVDQDLRRVGQLAAGQLPGDPAPGRGR